MKRLIVIFLFLSGSVFCFAQDETCSFTAEEAWNGDTSAMKKFLSSCGHIDTLNFDQYNKPSKKNPHHQTIAIRLNNGKIIRSDSVFFIVDQVPQFPGNETSLMQYLSDNIHYPETALQHKTEGRVFITFIIERDGKVSHAKVVHGIGNGCNEEALRVVAHMPPWIPGTMYGKPVRVQYSLPVKFALSGKTRRFQ